MAVKLIGIAGSPRKGQSTHFILTRALEAAQAVSPRIETVLIDLAENKVGPCLACGKCMKEPVCAQQDDFSNLLPILLDPELAGLIVASPVYFGCMSAQTKAFIDRLVVLRRNGTRLSGKVGGAMAVGAFRNGGQETTIHAIHAGMLIQDMIVVGDSFPSAHGGGAVWSGYPYGFEKDEIGLESALNLGRRVARTALQLNP